MGACFIAKTFPKSDNDKLKDAYGNMVADLVNEYGSSPFSGTFATNRGIIILPDRFADQNEAFEHLEDRAEKRGSAIAVKIGINPTLTDAEKKRLSDAQRARSPSERAMRDLKSNDITALNAIKGAKSARISCQTCTSSVARSFLKHTNCPVCGADDLRSKTQKSNHDRRIARVEADLKKTSQQIEKIFAAAKKRTKPDDWQWYVCALAGS
jgi:uncharacterized Zn finger protein (UPF0148 family)